MALFRGLSAFPITPCDAQGRIDADAMRALLGRLVASGVQSIGLLGSTGSYPYLDRAERRRAIEIAVDLVAGRLPILVGIGALRTDHAVQFGQDARAAGADAALLAPVSYTQLNREEVFTHFETVAREVGLPVCIYNNPGTTHFAIDDGLVARLSRVDNIVAVKNPATATAQAHLDALRPRVPPGFSLGCSVDWHATEAMLAGGDCWYGVLAGLFPARCVQIMQAVRAGDADEARRLDAGLAPIWELFVRFGSLRVMYACANRLGLTDAAPQRPVLPLPEPAQHAVAGVLDRLALD